MHMVWHRVKKKIVVYGALALAYSVATLESLFRLPIHFFVIGYIILLILITPFTIDPFFWDKLALLISYNTQTLVKSINTSHAFGDPLTAEQLYLDTLPLTTHSPQHLDVRGAAYPQEKLEQLRAFWTSTLTKQPSSREAYAALAAIHYRLQELEALVSTQKTWEFIEPNDPRIPRVTIVQ